MSVDSVNVEMGIALAGIYSVGLNASSFRVTGWSKVW